MKVASVVWNEQITNDNIASYIDELFSKAKQMNLQFIVFPAYIHEIYQLDGLSLMDYIFEISTYYADITICPGSYFEKVENEIFHSTSLIRNGKVILQQRQLYLANWEQKLNLSRGTQLNFIRLNQFKIALVLSTDTFYPQVIRHAKLLGVNLIVSPVAIVGQQNFARQISGLWQNVQQNTLFAIESGLKSDFQHKTFSSESIIHAPIEITNQQNGMLVREDENIHFIHATVHLEWLEKNVSFKPLQQLNESAYRHLF